MKRNPIPEPSDDALRREIEVALAVEPRPGFTARCRARIEEEPETRARIRFAPPAFAVIVAAGLAAFALLHKREAELTPSHITPEIARNDDAENMRHGSSDLKNPVPPLAPKKPSTPKTLQTVPTVEPVGMVVAFDDMSGLLEFLNGAVTDGALPTAPIQISRLEIDPLAVRSNLVPPLAGLAPLTIDPIPPLEPLEGERR